MEIIKLRCTTCNGTLKLDEENPNLAVCEYCQTKYILHQDADESMALESKQADRWYVPVEEKTTTRNYYNVKRGIVTCVIVLIIVIATRWEGLLHRFEQEQGASQTQTVVTESILKETTIQESVSVETKIIDQEICTGVLADVAVSVLQKPIEEIKVEDLACFKQMKIKYTMEEVLIGYSMELAQGSHETTLEWISFPTDEVVQEYSMLSQFKGIKKLEIANYLSAEAVKGLQLESLTCYAKSLKEVAQMLDTSQLKELNISAGLESLEGIEAFGHLESLSFNGYELKDIKPLVNLKHLKSLAIESGDAIKDFQVLSLMTGLESLSVESENLREISFLSGLTNLRSFEISDAQVLNLDTLAKLKQLKSLAVKSCDEVQNLKVLEGLTQLENLEVEVPYHCQSPNLSALGQLMSLSVDGIEDISFLGHMTNLQTLVLERCRIEDTQIFTALAKLKSLKCSAISGEVGNWQFITKIPALETLDLSGVSTYEDISCVFGISSLQTLLLNGMECEINFDKIVENPTLKVLEMDGMKLYKNAQVMGSHGFYAVDYDTVSFDENRSFLAKFTGLTDLSVADNTLTGIDFAQELHTLKNLDISGNYITDLKPLVGINSLQTVECTDNPIENDRVLGDKVRIIR